MQSLRVKESLFNVCKLKCVYTPIYRMQLIENGQCLLENLITGETVEIDRKELKRFRFIVGNKKLSIKMLRNHADYYVYMPGNVIECEIAYAKEDKYIIKHNKGYNIVDSWVVHGFMQIYPEDVRKVAEKIKSGAYKVEISKNQRAYNKSTKVNNYRFICIDVLKDEKSIIKYKILDTVESMCEICDERQVYEIYKNYGEIKGIKVEEEETRKGRKIIITYIVNIIEENKKEYWNTGF